MSRISRASAAGRIAITNAPGTPRYRTGATRNRSVP
jgi:hypothetical protein